MANTLAYYGLKYATVVDNFVIRVLGFCCHYSRTVILQKFPQGNFKYFKFWWPTI
jgi:hypothetical protein